MKVRYEGCSGHNDYLKQIDDKLAKRHWFSDQYSVADPYLFVFYVWAYAVQELKNFRALKDRLIQHSAVQLAKEKISL